MALVLSNRSCRQWWHQLTNFHTKYGHTDNHTMMHDVFFCHASEYVCVLNVMTLVMFGQCKNRKLRDNIYRISSNFCIHKSNTTMHVCLNLGKYKWHMNVRHIYMFMPTEENGIMGCLDEEGQTKKTGCGTTDKPGVFRMQHQLLYSSNQKPKLKIFTLLLLLQSYACRSSNTGLHRQRRSEFPLNQMGYDIYADCIDLTCLRALSSPSLSGCTDTSCTPHNILSNK